MAKPLTEEQLAALRAVPLGAMLNKLRIALALTGARQSDLVEEAGLDPAHVSRIVNGKYTSIDLETTRKFADFFSCQIEDLFPARAEVAS
jgi:DNA-binding Xre family transcriptional regulator